MAKRDATHRALARRRHLLADLLRGDPRTARPRDPDRRRHACASRSSRVTIEPFDLRQPVRYDVVIDRLTHWYHTSREWIKKAVILDDLYVFNNPWSVQSMEKHTTYCAMMRLGLPIPETWMIPPKDYEPTRRPASHARALRQALRPGRDRREARLPAVHEAVRRRRLGRRHARSTTRRQLRAAYEQSGTQGDAPADARSSRTTCFVRCIGLGPQTHVVNYDPAAPLHDRYRMDRDFLTAEEQSRARGHHAHDQRLLRLGLQLLRGAAEGRRLVPDRLRQRLPGLAGHVAALPLPVAGQGQPALVALLRGDAAADAPQPRLGAVLRGRRAATCPTARSSRATPRSRAQRFEPSASRSSAPSTWRTSTRSPGSSSARERARDAVRKKVDGAVSRRTRSSRSPSTSSGGSRTGASTRARPRPAPADAARAEFPDQNSPLDSARDSQGMQKDVRLATDRARGRVVSRAGATTARRCCSSRPPAATPRSASATA